MRILKSLLIAALVAGCASQSGQLPKGGHRLAATQTISASYDPSVSGLPGSVGDIVTVAGGATAWVKSGTGVTDWQAFPSAGGSGTVHVTAPVTGDGSLSTPVAISAATTIAAGSMSAADKVRLDAIPTLYSVISTPLGAAAQDLSVSGLHGDTDGGFDADGYILTATNAAPNYTLNFNGAAPTGAKTGGSFDTGAATGHLTAGANIYLASLSTAAPGHIVFHCRMGSKQGQYRAVACQSYSEKANDASTPLIYTTSGIFKMTAEITTMSVHSSAASSIDVTSELRVRALGFAE